MSTSCYGILYYGFKIELPEDSDSDLWALMNDSNEKWEDERKPSEPTDGSDYKSPVWDEWRKALKKWEATLEKIEIEFSGHSEYPSWFIHCCALEKRVEWAEQINLGRSPELKGHPKADKYIKDFCEQFGLEFKEPSWNLASRYF